ncbi:Glyoxalase/Bleomycin resistance protein/Dihydroxybiphenyl dioxygenase, partial [Rozella allomycis CSF55]
TTYEKRKERPSGGRYYGFDHIVFWVGNAKQAASFYCTRYGFTEVAYQGLETGHRDVVSRVVKQNDIILVFQSQLNPGKGEMADHLATHGDGVKDVAFTVEDCRSIYEKAMKRGAKSVAAPKEIRDEHGVAILATIKTYGDTVHTFVERKNYKGLFLPGFVAVHHDDTLVSSLAETDLNFIDHIVGNQPDLQMVPVCEM